ncbi:arginase family protein [Agrobacterium rosae]|uniref:arginase family protein n=1 Tax=Agrobacterium rosae TaxID=1972867 RepID=UPI003BA0EDEF
MTVELIVSQGRVADRTTGAIAGAWKTADILSKNAEHPMKVIGIPSAAKDGLWSVDLAEAGNTLRGLQAVTRDVMSRGSIPLLVLNTCAASIATLPVVARQYPEAVVMWIDAHGDFNTPETTGSGYLGGMVLGAGCGLWDSGYGDGVDPRNVMIVGGRDIDVDEDRLLRGANVIVLPPERSTPLQILEMIGSRKVWIHIDWDVLQPGYVPAAYSVDEGFRPQDLKAILAAIPKSQILGIEVCEFEASGNEDEDATSLEIIIDIVSVLME